MVLFLGMLDIYRLFFWGGLFIFGGATLAYIFALPYLLYSFYGMIVFFIWGGHNVGEGNFYGGAKLGVFLRFFLLYLFFYHFFYLEHRWRYASLLTKYRWIASCV